ncbi:MAG: transposase [Deltaproteobacteria bacterium]|nr:MAG: transposase [Deltaproteobacteria bacterium]
MEVTKMLVRELKLKPTKRQEATLNEWLWCLTGVYNWASRKIELDAQDKIYHRKLAFQNSLSGVSKKLDIPSHTIQATILQAYNAWERCFKKVSKQPKLKSVRNKLRSICFPDPLNGKRISENRISLPGLKSVRFYKQDLPEGSIKQARIVKRALGWYCQICIDTVHIFPVENTDEAVGIDTGFKDLAILSTGKKFSNGREFVKGQKRLAQAQRGGRKKLAARLYERISSRRKDYNHKVSRQIVQNFKEIYITNDNLRGQAKIFGKSVSDAGISQLRQFLIYKGAQHSRKVVLVDSKYTTMTCSICGSLTGPTGLSGLVVRTWKCGACGAQHDRDVNAAKVILKSGLGCSLGVLESSGGAR